jgi:hypothetical protein
VLAVKVVIPLAIVAVLIYGGAGCVKTVAPGLVACTQEAKQCPDGSYVGRTGPNCEFTACPSPSPVPEPAPVPPPLSLDCSGLGDLCPSGYTCIQKCGPPVARVDDPSPGYYCESNALASQPRRCPICLASNTIIGTPNGNVNVKDVTIGMSVWSANERGEKVVSRVVAVSHADVPTTHQVVHLKLSDGREVWVSPNHPDAGGEPIVSLRPGDVFDGSIVRSSDLVPYWDTKTYDLLPDSATGTYWANGVLLGSTLVKTR